jgi:hypothetical protein
MTNWPSKRNVSDRQLQQSIHDLTEGWMEPSQFLSWAYYHRIEPERMRQAKIRYNADRENGFASQKRWSAWIYAALFVVSAAMAFWFLSPSKN